MATAIITITDKDDSIDVAIEFGEGGAQDDSNAHHMALQALLAIKRAAAGEEDDDG